MRGETIDSNRRSRRWRLGPVAVLLSILTLLSVVAPYGIGGAGPIGVASAAEPTAVTSCQVIDSPGRYELAADITNTTITDACIEVTTGGVALDGNGHTIAVAGVNAVEFRNSSAQLSNATVTDLTVTGARLAVWAFNVRNVTVTDLTVTASDDGVEVTAARTVRVADSTFDVSTDGVVTTTIQTSSVIENNTVTGDGSGSIETGIGLESASGPDTVRNNTVSGFGHGIHVEGGSTAHLADNVVHDNEHGILLDGTEDATLRRNEMANNDVNLDVTASLSRLSWAVEGFTHDVDTSNTVDGRPVYYLVDASGVTIDESTNAGFVAVVNSRDVTVRDLALSYNSQGVLLVNTTGATVENVSATHLTEFGVQLAYVHDSFVTNNTIADSAGASGIFIKGSHRNTIENNSVTAFAGSLDSGIHADDSNRNAIRNNTVADTTLTTGIGVSDGHNNTVAWNDVSRNRETSTDGIDVSEAPDTTVLGNTVEENSAGGISVVYSPRFTVADNVVRNNDLDGIYLQDSPDGHLCGNTLSGNRDSIVNDSVSAYDTNCSESDDPENQPPTAHFVYSPSSPAADEIISFDASGSSDLDGTIASYGWDFDGDGQFDDASGASPTTSFSPAGDYPVALEVTDDGGATDETTTTVSVLDVDAIASCGVAIDSPGLYRLAGDLTDSSESACVVVASSDVTLDGNGHTIDGVDGSDTVGVAVSGSSPRLNVTVRNLTLTDWDDGVWVGDGSDATLQDLSVEDSTTGVAVVGGADATLQDVEVTQNVVGVDLGGAGDVVLDGGYFRAGSHAISSSGAESIVVTEADIETSGVGLYLTDGPVIVENVTVNALVTSTSDADVGVRLSNATGTVRNLDLESSDVGIKAYESAVTVEDAELYDVNTGVELTGGTDATLRGVEVPQGVTGVKLSDAGDVVVDGGYVDVGVHGIQSLGAESLQVSGLDIEAGGSGMVLWDGLVTVEDVSVNALVTSTSDANVGVSLSNATGTLQELNLESANVGVKLYESDATISDATLNDVNTGVEITDGSNATLTDIEFTQGVSGIKLDGAGNVVVDGGDLQVGVHGVISYGAESVQVENVAVVGSNGVSLYDGVVTLDNVSFTGTGAPTTGVSLDNVTGTVDDLTVDAASVGVEVYEANVTVRDSTLVVPTGGDGVTASSADLVLEAVTIDRGDADHYEVGVNGTEGTKVTIRGGDVRNATFGISIADSTATVRGATITNPDDTGIYGSNAALDVRDAHVTGVGAGAVMIRGVFLEDGSLGTVANTTVRAGSFGIRLSTDGDVTLIDNDVEAFFDGVIVEGGVDATVRDNHVVANDNAILVLGIPDRTVARIESNTLTGGGDGAAVEFGNGGTGILRNNELHGPVGVLAESDSPVFVPGEGGVTVVNNDLSNATVALRNDNETATANGMRNYYGPRGPAPGRVVGNWSLGVFLTAPPRQMDANDTQQFGFDVEMPAGQVYAFGTPAATEDTLDDVFGDFQGAIYRYDETSQSWSLATGDERLDAMDAVAVVPTTDARAVIDFADATPPRPAERQLTSGWNFVAPRAYDDLDAAFSTATVGITDVSQSMAEPQGQPADPGDAFGHYSPAGGEPSPRVSPFTGYFVYADETGAIPGRVLYGERIDDVHVHLRIDSPTTDTEK